MILYRYEKNGLWLGRDGAWHASKRKAARFRQPQQIEGATARSLDMKPFQGSRSVGLGLKELIRRSQPGECPLCGDPVQPIKNEQGRAKKEYRLLCGDPECRRAYHIYYGRDRRSQAHELDSNVHG